MKTTVTTIALILSASLAAATPNNSLFGGNTSNTNVNTNKNTNLNNATAIANQTQGQAQQQGQAQGQGQGQTQSTNASNSNSINMEGSVGIAVGSAACTSGFSVGAPGAGAIGFSFSDKDCKIVQEAQVLWAMGMHDAARTHMTQVARIAHSIRAVTPQPPAPAVSTRSAPETLYTSCRVEGRTPHITVPAGSDASYIQRAAAQCFATR